MKPHISVLTVENGVASHTLRRALQHDHDIDVVATAHEAGRVLDLVARHRPALVVVDADGRGAATEIIEGVMASTPTPIVVVSSASRTPDSRWVSEALASGALEALPKPTTPSDPAGSVLRQRVRVLSKVVVMRRRRRSISPPTLAPLGDGSRVPIVAIGASTGGPPAVASVLRNLYATEAAVLLVQHLHTQFLPGFVAWLSGETTFKVVVAVEGMTVTPGYVYVAPGEHHLVLDPSNRLRLMAEPKSLHRPSVDELFFSVARNAGRRAVGVVLTGMGNDGAAGLTRMREAGATTIAQDEATSAVFGMPKAAIANDAAGAVLPLGSIADAISSAIRRSVV